jgi:hypothetical protein
VTNAQNTVSPLAPATTPRARRGDAAVIARYIQDLTHAGNADVRPPA